MVDGRREPSIAWEKGDGRMNEMKQIIERDRACNVQVYSPEPLVFERGEGMHLYDTDGRCYLDFSAQFSSCSLGHGNREMQKAISEQIEKVWSVTSMFVTRERVALGETMQRITPPGLDKMLLGCTGSDANEFALKAAKCYMGGGKIFSFWRGFHGSTGASAAATGKSETIQENPYISELLPRGFVHTSPPYCYRCDFGKTCPDCGFQCLKYLEKQILHEGGEKVAGVMLEPVFAAGGVIEPPKGYLTALRALCDKYHCLLIFDEVVTGFGQTGTMFACEQEGVTPDILVSGKALTSGYIPGSVVMMRREIAEVMDRMTLHGHTHSFYPGVCAAALKNIEIIERDQLVENARVVGAYLKEKLLTLMERFDVIGDVRGRGLLQGVELVTDRKSRQAHYALGERLFRRMLEHGLITELESRKNLENVVIVLHPPLITSKADVDKAVEIMDTSLVECLKD